ncbi:phage head closure protein [Paenibacillus elgii]|uniref:phage head closure protein n=1 Tax=Paenibacillus elgii TaxID=189691 RepID=UPI000248E093|nr:phage head closure protein [Paenibacillus elgii]
MTCKNCKNCDRKDDLTGRLKRRVTFHRPPTGADSYGEPIDQWPVVASAWAAIEPLRGREYFEAQREHADVTTRIIIRYRPDIDRTMIVVYGKTTFEIGHIIHPDFAKRELHLMCKERQ